MAHEALSIHTVNSLSEIVRAATGTHRVRRLLFDVIVTGTARSIGNDTGGFLRADQDIRDAYLRVTTIQGWDAYWPVNELVVEIPQGFFVVG